MLDKRDMHEKNFEFQKWPVYERALDFVVQAYRLCGELPKNSASSLRDQLRRASHSITLNIGEGSSRYTGPDKAYLFRVARGSVFECVAILDIIRRVELIDKDLGPMYLNLEAVGKMLSGLIRYVESDKYKTGKPEKPAARV